MFVCDIKLRSSADMISRRWSIHRKTKNIVFINIFVVFAHFLRITNLTFHFTTICFLIRLGIRVVYGAFKMGVQLVSQMLNLSVGIQRNVFHVRLAREASHLSYQRHFQTTGSCKEMK